MATAPGVYVSVTAAPPSPNGVVATGQWFVTGQTYQGPTGVAIPITSMTDYTNFLGQRVSYGYLYDSLNEFFADGGVLAWVSRLVGPSASKATVTVGDRGGSPQNTLTFTSVGSGVWGNSLSVVVANGTTSNSYTIQVLNGGTSVIISPNLFTPADAVTWFASQSSWLGLVAVTNSNSTNTAPTNNPANGNYTLTGGTDDTADVTDTQWTAALTAFGSNLGPGQVSAPGHTTTTGYGALNAHAIAFNRYALLDVADNASAAALITQAQNAQGVDADPSYSAMFAPWVVIPGITSTNPGSSSPVPNRTIPPSAVAAALMAKNDQTNDANNPAAGAAGVSSYAIGLSQAPYTNANYGSLNAAGISMFQIINAAVTLYGYRSLALDPNWIFLNNVRFRMQVINDFNTIGQDFVFQEIDGNGQLFARFNGALAGKCNSYYINGSLYGPTSNSAFTVNTGPQVNTPTTIASGAIAAQVLLRMSPEAEFVNISVIKYGANQTLPVS